MNFETNWDFITDLTDEHLKQERGPKLMDMGELSRDESGNYHAALT